MSRAQEHACFSSRDDRRAWLQENHAKADADLQKALRRHSGMLKAFRELAPFRKKQYLSRIGSAKRQETRHKRVTALIE